MDKDFAQNIIKAQMDVNAFIEGILVELAMSDLPEPEKKQMKQILLTALEKFFISRVIGEATEEQLAKMQARLAEDQGIYRLMDYVQENFDQDGRLTELVLGDFKKLIIEKMKSKE